MYCPSQPKKLTFMLHVNIQEMMENRSTRDVIRAGKVVKEAAAADQ